jgi:gas vesicle protein
MGKLLWFVAGASIGATLALVFAPQPGEETRRYLGEKRDDVLETGRELFEKGRELADDAAGLIDRGRRIFES